MENITTESELRAAILQLEIRQAEQGRLLRDQFHLAYESVKPVNLAISALKDLASSSDLRENLLNTSVGLGTGYVSKLLFQSASGSPLRKLIGSVLMFGITNLVTKNPDVIKSIGNGLFRLIKRKIKGTDRAHEYENN